MAIKAQVAAPKPKNKPFDMRALWRLGFWGSSAAVALAAVVIVTQSDTGAQRLQVAVANVRDPAMPALPTIAQLIPRDADSAGETRRLAAAVRDLRNDRDRLLTRIAGLERNLDDMTGSIKTAPASARSEAHTASAAPAITNVTPAPAELTAARMEFGADIGGAASMEALRSQWAAAKANHGPLFEGLLPVVGVNESRPGMPELRLIVGPLANAAAAAKLCTTLAAARMACRAAVFEGQRLAAR